MKCLIFSKPACPACERAIRDATSLGYDIEVVKIIDSDTKQRLLDLLPTARSVPQIFIDGVYVGQTVPQQASLL